MLVGPTTRGYEATGLVIARGHCGTRVAELYLCLGDRALVVASTCRCDLYHSRDFIPFSCSKSSFDQWKVFDVR
jgi:hypothetical protein